MTTPSGGDAPLEERALALARTCSATTRGRGRPLRRHVAELEQRLRLIDERLTAAKRLDIGLGPAAEWLLDNAHLVAEALHQVVEGIPPDFYRKLPKVSTPPHEGRSRVYVIAREVVGGENVLDLVSTARFLETFQSIAPLTVGELWAFPTMLRLALLEILSDLSSEIAVPPVDAERESTTAAVGRRIGVCITGLRIVSAQDWKSFFESLSLVERQLRNDPAHVYAFMDFETRDRYRKAVEQLAVRADVTEVAVATAATEAAARAADEPVRSHIGFFLIGDGRSTLHRTLGCKPALRNRAADWISRHATAIYLTGLVIVTLGLVAFPLSHAYTRGASALVLGLLAVAALIPALSIAVSAVHWLITHVKQPTVLPKMDFDAGIPADCRAIVVVPTLLTSPAEVRDLLRKLEVSFHGNRDEHLAFALLTDFADGQSQSMPGDDSLIEQAIKGVRNLNEQYGGGVRSPFFLFHRERRWNECEGRWMGWERKRGKLAEFNHLVLGSDDTSYCVKIGDLDALTGIRYVITLDTDTGLPRGTAARLVATLAHPLNRAQFDAEGRVTSGYTVLQPRIEMTPRSASGSMFATVFHGDTGLDLYTRAVSDVYQDFFGEGIYAGKGIYDVAAFERSLAGRVPENALLSHDLFEGVHGRAGLASDLALFEEYPDHVLAYGRRMHRWVRGDWQLLPWLSSTPPGEQGRVTNRLSVLSRWKIIDNLRRSLVAPSVLVFVTIGWLWLPGSPWFWTALGVGIVGIPILLSAASVATRLATGAGWSSTLKGAAWSLPTQFFRFIVAAIFLAFESVVVVDAVARTLYRLKVSRRSLLQWTSAAHSARAWSQKNNPATFWRELYPASLLAIAIGGAVWLIRPASFGAALLPVALWLLAPQLAWLLSLPRVETEAPLPESDHRMFRLLARRTWHYYERFIGPGDHWLAPDNYQEEPLAAVARRTSPTNLGLALIAPVAAYDFGYVGPMALAATVRNMVDSMSQLERYRGHFLNWYETVNRSALLPRYVSVVDSGNLAACLIVLREAHASVLRAPIVRGVERQGLLDTIDVLTDVLHQIPRQQDSDDLDAILDHVKALEPRVRHSPSSPQAHRALLVELKQIWLTEFEHRVSGLVAQQNGQLDIEVLKDLRAWSERVRYAIVAPLRELDLLFPWIPLLDELPAMYARHDRAIADAWQPLREILERSLTLRGLVFACTKARKQLDLLEASFVNSAASEREVEEARKWNARLREKLDQARQSAEAVLADFHAVTTFAEATVDEMDFAFLFDEHRRLFHIGYNVSAGEFDTSYYDLLASEARIASLVAIAKGDVPVSHWLYLRRPFGRVGRKRVLLSWSGTMFEFLMPNLFTSVPGDSVLAESAAAAVHQQIAFADDHRIPWGISESGFYQLDAHANYQYRAFGVPGLGLRPDLGDRLVIAPYASILALSVRPAKVAANVRRFDKLGMIGRYGLVEAIDYGPSKGQRAGKGAVVRSYMTHHQGMIFQALNNFLNANRMVRRFHRDPRIASTELLLYEHPPRHVPVQRHWRPEKRSAQPIRPPVASESWLVPTEAPVPAIHVLSNRRYSVLLTARGGGHSRWQGLALTRWRADPSVDAWGTWIYVRDLESGDVWSVGVEPTHVVPEAYEVEFAPHMAEYSRHDHGISLRMNVMVPPGDDVEVRRITVVNDGDSPRQLTLTSYGEVVLAPTREDARHQAFNKLFVQSRYQPTTDLLLFERRARSATEEPVFLAHGVSAHDVRKLEIVGESDREAFLGRGGTRGAPDVLYGKGARVSVASGATLDPVFSLACKFEIAPKGEAVLIFVTAVGRSAAEVLAVQENYRSLTRVDWAFDQCRSYSEFELHELGIPADAVRPMQEAMSALLYPYHALRSVPREVSGEQRPRSGLWAHGISGDHPILLVRVAPSDDLTLVRRLLAARTYWLRRQVRVDVVVLDEGSTGYLQPLHDRLRKAIEASSSDMANPLDGVFLLSARQLDPAERNLLERSAHLVLSGGAGSLETQLTRLAERPHTLPGFVPVPSEPHPEPTPRLERPSGLQFDNEIGGFGADGREYVLHLEPGVHTPAPWINVVANPQFGFLVSESGGGYTWSGNSGENRLTSWHNDPVADEPSEIVYLRDEETARVWTPTPNPAGNDAAYQVRHGAGYTEFRHHSDGLEQCLTLFVDKDEPIKVVRLTLRNHWQRRRRITATYFADWVLGTSRDLSAPHVLTQFDADAEALVARNPFSETYGTRVAFLAASQTPHSVTSDRSEFLGEAANFARPPGLERIGLSGTTGGPLNPCAALQLHIEIAPGGDETVHFLLGQGRDLDHARQLVQRFRPLSAGAAALAAVQAFWDDRLGRLTVDTPDAAMNVMLNRWLLYQSIVCRLWGRSGLYQSSGAFGFRDQLQDVMAVAPTWPEVARAHILEAARHQFTDGDVLHWWHPETDQGVRTRCSDDLVWLPYVTAYYVAVTGDEGILSEQIPYLVGPPLAADEHERYGSFDVSGDRASLYDHCVRALERAVTAGPHHLPLIGTCDWNDGLSRVGIEGRGESVWLGWFLYAALTQFAPLSEERDDPSASQFREQAEFIRRAVEEYGWDGHWYRRAYYDDGTPIGSADSDEAQIDSIAQSWAVLSGAGNHERQRQALASAMDRLVHPDKRLILLLTPPFDQTSRDPGYIKGYPPGVRENGGQYTHAAIWLVWAVALLGDGDQAYALFDMLNPVHHGDSPAAVARYRVEPYVVAADVYGIAPHTGRGGWTWYTGSAAWLYRVGIEALLGLRKCGDTLHVEPCIPRDWPAFHAVLRHGTAEYRITVENRVGEQHGVASIVVDGDEVDGSAIPLIDDGTSHEVVVRLGEPPEGDRDEVGSGAASGER